MQESAVTPSAKQSDNNSSDVDDFIDELQFDPTVSSGHFGQLGEGGFRSTPITVGVCPTPQPVNPPTPQPTHPAQTKQAEDTVRVMYICVGVVSSTCR